MAKKKTESIEECIIRLQTIASEMEDPATSLEKSINLYEEGIKLAVKCGEKLKSHELSVMILKKEAEDIFQLEPFTGSV